MKLYQKIARCLLAMRNCEQPYNQECYDKHEQTIEALVKEHMPSGSGFDAGTRFVWDTSTPNKLVFETDFHHMNDTGYYVGWTFHRITVRADLAFDYDIVVSGRNKNGIKDYILETFDHALEVDVK